MESRLPELIRQTRAAGFRINNLFHRADGRCQANLRSDSTPACFEFAVGRSFTEALEGALAKAGDGERAAGPKARIGVVVDQATLAPSEQIDPMRRLPEFVAPWQIDPLDELLG